MQLFVMTGDFMTGKTTWVARMLDAAEQRDADRRPSVAGVLCPAVFENGKKTGIDAVLLPKGERFAYARPRTGTFVDERAEHGSNGSRATGGTPVIPASPAQMGWKFDDAATERINRHFASPACASCDLLVIDEIGPLELKFGRGYTEALRLLDAGVPSAALAIVRPALLEDARARWGQFEELTPASSIENYLTLFRSPR